jgi:hypothetical protein
MVKILTVIIFSASKQCRLGGQGRKLTKIKICLENLLTNEREYGMIIVEEKAVNCPPLPPHYIYWRSKFYGKN